MHAIGMRSYWSCSLASSSSRSRSTFRFASSTCLRSVTSRLWYATPPPSSG